MNYKAFFESMEVWSHDLRRTSKIGTLRLSFMNAESMGDVNSIMASNMQFIEDNIEDCAVFIRNAITRIERLRKEQMKSWKTNLN